MTATKGANQLLKSQRLLAPNDFSNLKSGSRVQKFSSGLIISKFNSHSEARLGLAVSRKSGNAVRRNLIKRITREFFRLSSLRTANLDVLLVSSASLKNLSKDDLVTNLRRDLAQAFSTLQKSSSR